MIGTLPAAPILIGHSFSGLFAQKLLGEGIGRAAIAIDPAQIKGVLPLPLVALRSALPALANPLNRSRAVALTRDEFRFGFGNALAPAGSDAMFDRWTILSPAKPLFEAALANFSLPPPPRSTPGTRTAARCCSSRGPPITPCPM